MGQVIHYVLLVGIPLAMVYRIVQSHSGLGQDSQEVVMGFAALVAVGGFIWFKNR